MSTEADIAVIPLEGFSNWEHVEPFAWLWDRLLKRSVPVFVVLDRDYRTEAAVQRLNVRLRLLGIRSHVWGKKELESYFLVPTAIARLSGTEIDLVDQVLEREAAALRSFVFARVLASEQEEADARGRSVPVTERVTDEFEQRWMDPSWRLSHCPAKDLFHRLNAALDANGDRPLSIRRLAAALRTEEIDGEMARVIDEIEAELR